MAKCPKRRRPGAKIMLEFMATAKRGVCSDLGAPTRDNDEE